jgi:hypothetical protein
VRAKEPLEVLTLNRRIWMRVLHRNDGLLRDFKALINTRRQENEYYRFGTVTVIKKASTVMMAAAKLSRTLKKRVADRRAGRPREGAPNFKGGTVQPGAYPTNPPAAATPPAARAPAVAFATAGDGSPA